MADQDEISLRELLALLKRERWIVGGITFACAVLAGLIAWMLPPQFEATVMISPVSNTSPAGRLSGGQGGAGGAGLGGLAALVGITLGSDSNRAESLAVLQSEALTERYIREHNLLPILFHSQWDPQLHKWRNPDPRKQPTVWKGNKFFEKIRLVTEDKKSGLVTMTITWTDPVLAAR